MIESFKTLAKGADGYPVRKSRKPTIVHTTDLTTVRGAGKIRYEYRSYKSGAGPHANKADKRCRTRGNQLKKAIDYGND